MSLEKWVIDYRVALLWLCSLSLVAGLGTVSPQVLAQEKTLLVYGDSLSAAYGMAQSKGWVALLANKLRLSHPQWQVVNLSVSGETTSGGLNRLPEALKTHTPDLVLLQLGANDGLRGTPLPSMHKNLSAMLAMLARHRIPVVLFEMHIPANYGPAYTRRFNAIYEDVSKADHVTLVPFFLDGVAGRVDLNQADGIHPAARAQPLLLANVWPSLQPLLN